jgi:DNA-binding NarL/FixJ family response regulator
MLTMDSVASSRCISRNWGGEILGEATEGLGAISMADKLKPDLMLMDLEIPDGDGF